MNALVLSVLSVLAVHAAPKSDAKSDQKAESRDAKAEARAEARAGLMRFNYKYAEINRVIEDYAKASGQKFIVDGTVKGHVSIFNPAPISVEEAFNQMSTALAANSIGISTREDQMVIAPARNTQRDLIPVVTELPPVRPDRMVTLVVNLKNVNADEVNKQIRIFTSRDGELVPYTPNNQLLITDWTPNLHRIAAIIRQLDVPSENPGAPSSPPPAALAQPDDRDPRPEVPVIPTLKVAPKTKGK